MAEMAFQRFPVDRPVYAPAAIHTLRDRVYGACEAAGWPDVRFTAKRRGQRCHTTVSGQMVGVIVLCASDAVLKQIAAPLRRQSPRSPR